MFFQPNLTTPQHPKSNFWLWKKRNSGKIWKTLIPDIYIYIYIQLLVKTSQGVSDWGWITYPQRILTYRRIKHPFLNSKMKEGSVIRQVLYKNQLLWKLFQTRHLHPLPKHEQCNYYMSSTIHKSPQLAKHSYKHTYTIFTHLTPTNWHLLIPTTRC